MSPEELIENIIYDSFPINIANEELIGTDDGKKFVYIYKVSVLVKNTTGIDAKAMKLSIHVSENVEVDGKTNSYINIAKGEEKTVDFLIKIIPEKAQQIIEYSVSLSFLSAKMVTAYNNIIVEGVNYTDNRMQIDDCWKFKNFATTDLGKLETLLGQSDGVKGNRMPLSQDDCDAIRILASDKKIEDEQTEYEVIKRKIESGSSGLCYGFAVSSILFKMGVLNVKDYDKDAKTVRELKKNNENVKSLISFYYLSQYTKCSVDHRREFSSKNIETKLREIEQIASNVKSGGSPAVLSILDSIKNPTIAHAVVIYDLQNGDYRIKGKKYNKRIAVYDSNHAYNDKNSFLYINTETSEWIMPNYSNYSFLRDLQNDLNTLNYLNRKDGLKTVQSYNSGIVVDSYDNYQFGVYNENGDMLFNVSGGIVDGVGSDYFADPSINGKVDAILYYLPKIENENSYVIKSNSDLGLRMYWYGSNMNFYAKAGKENSVKFKETGEASLSGVASDFKLKLAPKKITEEISIIGKSAENPTLQHNGENFYFSANNMREVNAYLENNGSAEKLEIKTKSGTICLAIENNTLKEKTDTDGDGVYETTVSVSETIQSSQLQKECYDSQSQRSSSIDLKIAMIVAAVLTISAIILIIGKCKKKKEK